MDVNPDAGLEPHAILVDKTDASHWHMKEIRRHLSNAVEGRFGRCVEDLVAPECVQALGLELGEPVFIGSTPDQSQTIAAGGRRS